jgi:hypothetical protein
MDRLDRRAFRRWHIRMEDTETTPLRDRATARAAQAALQ